MILSSITLDEVENILGAELLKMWGSDIVGLTMLALFFIVAVLGYASMRGLGEGALYILLGVCLYAVSVGFAGQGTLISIAPLILFFLISAGIIAKAWGGEFFK